MKTVNIGLIGFGTVGAGVVETILKNGELIGQRTGVLPVLKRIADLDITTDRGVKVPAELLTTDAMSLIADPEIQVVVELVGGTGIAKRFVCEALKAGKAVVTANKALLAKYGEELFALAAENHTEIYFEASVGGGIPCIKALREGLVANRIHEIYGILNGTCNYILTRMEQEQADFGTVLAAAQKAGYAEADPAADVDGYDTANKAAILASLAFGRWFTVDDVDTQGIRDITIQDIANAAELGYRIKL
ncbi:MAG: homoserine dehydrogenase, partial [Victivallales bacterium]|nr:homoserine dehydrogenase [Victivallales bacterium]